MKHEPSRTEKLPADLISELESTVRGEVRFDRGSRALYASDHSIYRHIPIGVVIPRDEADVEATVAACRARNVPILGRGTGTSLSGQTCNVAVVIDFSKYMNRILEINPGERYAWVEPGVICDQLRKEAEKHALTFAPDPATHRFCCLGGMIGNNSCGAHSVMGGKTVDNVEELEILTYGGMRLRVGPVGDELLLRLRADQGQKGEVFRSLYSLRERYAARIRDRYPKIPRRVSGYNLDQLLPENGFHVARALVGSESTCVLVLKAKLRLMHSPRKKVLLVLGYPGPVEAANAVPALRAQGPIALECFHSKVMENMERKGKSLPGRKLIPKGDAWLLVEFGADDLESGVAKARGVQKKIESQKTNTTTGAALLTKPEEQELVWEIRESGVGASHIPSVEEAYPGWEDAAVNPERLGDYLRELMALLGRYQYTYTLYGHFGDGCVHTRIAWDLRTADGIRKMRSFIEEAADLVVKYGGSISGEHGDGQSRAELLPRMFGDELVGAFREFKSIWDPDNRMNPGKIVNAYRLDENLRLGTDYAPPAVKTEFSYPDDRGSFAKATERCFGIGKCRRLEEGTMCPSFRATREEKHTTRGRTRLLFEMMRGEVIVDGWKSEEIKEALDLCLACKGCRGDCPVSVDVATYKAEFLSHYYEGRIRPPQAYAMGYIYRWGQLGSISPGFANLFLQNKTFAKMFGFTEKRNMPGLARETFQRWWARRGRPLAAPKRRRIILWPDTFNNYFWPQTARSAVEVLESLSYDIDVPGEKLCCGRPLFDFGLIDDARKNLQKILDVLRPSIRSGIPVVGLEPSCVSVFRLEMMDLFPHNEDARRLSEQVFTLAEFLHSESDLALPHMEGTAVLHGHCHQKAMATIDPDRRILEALGLQVLTPDTGCCGMGGSMGWEAEKVDISLAIGELVIFPLVRSLSLDTLVVADGFSCRSQIEHGAQRRPLHLAEVFRMAQDTPKVGIYPEQRFLPQPAKPSTKEIAAWALSGGSIAAALFWAVLLRKDRD